MQYDGKPYAYWNDRNGARRYFWAGDNQTSDQVLCQCGLDQSCVDGSKNCNCDSSSCDSTYRLDQGYIRDKNILPVSKLNFG